MLKKMIMVEIIFTFIISVCILVGKSEKVPTSVEVDGEDKKIALTFDDGPGQYTEELLDGLLERNVKATFFLIGKNIEMYPDTVKRMAEEGHTIGNHTYSHVELTCITEEKAVEEIKKTNELIEGITGNKVKYIRPPFGLWTKKLEAYVKMKPVLWDVDPRDWSVLNTNTVTCHVVNNAEDDDIVLMHDIYQTSVDAAMNIVDILMSKGYQFVTVDELYDIGLED